MLEPNVPALLDTPQNNGNPGAQVISSTLLATPSGSCAAGNYLVGLAPGVFYTYGSALKFNYSHSVGAQVGVALTPDGLHYGYLGEYDMFQSSLAYKSQIP